MLRGRFYAPASFTALLLAATIASACAQRAANRGEHADHDTAAPASPSVASRGAGEDTKLPPSAATAAARLAASPRHGEYAMIADPLTGDSVRLWVVFPERRDKAPVVVVIHEIFGLSGWIRSVADQLAAEGYIAIAPDLLTGKRLPGAPDSVPIDSAVAAVRALDPAAVLRQVKAAAHYGMSLPAALPKYGVIGFCWGGSMVFAEAATDPDLGAAVAYYGGTPAQQFHLSNTKAPVLAFYGGNDARVTSTIPAADSGLRAAGIVFEKVIYPGAGHGFLRQQDGQDGANLAATRAAWPRTVAFLRQHLGK